jgi:hypothetical protein
MRTEGELGDHHGSCLLCSTSPYWRRPLQTFAEQVDQRAWVKPLRVKAMRMIVINLLREVL